MMCGGYSITNERLNWVLFILLLIMLGWYDLKMIFFKKNFKKRQKSKMPFKFRMMRERAKEREREGGERSGAKWFLRNKIHFPYQISIGNNKQQ